LKRKSESVRKLQHSAGFSLIEMIVTLALLSLISLILFQSAITQWSNMQRISLAFERAQNLPLREEIFRDVAGQLLPGWPEQQIGIFRGGPEGFSGITLRPFSALDHQLAPLDVRISNQGAGQSLIMGGEDANDILASEISNARFDYKAMDGSWHDRWPPETKPGNGFFTDQVYFETPQLPEVIRLRFSRSNTRHIWYVTPHNRNSLPFRLEDPNAGDNAL
jgi:prepilin-type N-terminal cleavage/methylation domain-containing protein